MSLLQSIDYHAISPVLVAAGTALAVLLADLARPGWRVVPWLGLAGVVAALGAAASLAGDPRATFCTPPTRLPAVFGGTPLAVGRSCSYVADGYAVLLQIVLLAAAAVVILLSVGYVSETRVPGGEYHFLLLSSVTGMLTLAAARDLLTLVVALEVVSLPVFVLVGLRRADPRSTESALKFFLVSVLATAVMLLGAALVYGVTGSIQLDRVAAALGRPQTHLPLTAAAVMLVIVGFGFKVSAVPFHTWTPDTYQGAPLPVAAFLATASKAAGFAGLLAVTFVGFRPYANVWGPALAGLAIATMSLGNLVALQQDNAVRLLAWSSIAQAGYMLVPLGVAASAHGRTDEVLRRSAAATLAYLAIYVAMTVGAFGCVTALARRHPRNALVDYRGLGRRSPALALALAFFLLCLAGLPPGLAGLFAKVVVFRAAVDGAVVWLAIVMALNTVVALAYYLRWAALMFSGVGEHGSNTGVASTDGAAAVGVPAALGVGIGLAAAGTVALSVYPQLLLHVTPLATFATG